MSIDMKQFHSVFFEESQEHLDEMEQLLLNLDMLNSDSEKNTAYGFFGDIPAAIPSPVPETPTFAEELISRWSLSEWELYC